jgi:hypothetical protein
MRLWSSIVWNDYKVDVFTLQAGRGAIIPRAEKSLRHSERSDQYM